MTALPFETWRYEEQTRMKHLVFKDYIKRWMTIVGKKNNLNYIDGFGGIGAYKDEEGNLFYGSPVLALQAAEQLKEEYGRNVQVGIIDNNPSHIDNIDKIIDFLSISIKPIRINADFDEAINRILEDHPRLAPTFVFVDPWGYSIRLETISKIMQVDKSEVLLNFMYSPIHRFICDSSKDHAFCDLFGGDEWKQFRGLHGKDRETGIINHFRSKLKGFSRYVTYYRFEYPQAKRTYYYLFHLTNHQLGCSIMKSSFAKYNLGDVEYQGTRIDRNQLEMFDKADFRIEEAKAILSLRYRGRSISFSNIVSELIDETEFLEMHIREALKELEKEEAVRISRIPEKTKTGRIRTGIEGNDIITFF